MDPRKTSRALIIFIKNPLSGKVKTRLARESSDDFALKVYNTLLSHTRSVTASIQATKYLYYSNHIPEVDEWDDKIYKKHVQVKGSLGQKMKAAILYAFSNHDEVLIIGSDCIQLQESDLEQAFQKLGQYDSVLGPALDGGYYLLGLKKIIPQLFEGIPWSTEHVTDKTLEKLITSGYSCHFLRPLSDIDYLEDWQRYGYEL